MKKHLLLLALTSLSFVGFAGCSDDDGDSELENLGRQVQQAGSIRGTVAGFRNDDTPFTYNIDFKHSTYNNLAEGYVEFARGLNPGSYGNEYNDYEDYAYLSFTFDPANISAATADLDDFDMQLSQRLPDGTLFIYSGDWGSGEAPVTWERLSYDANTKRFSGKFTITYASPASFSYTGNNKAVTFSIEFDVLPSVASEDDEIIYGAERLKAEKE